MHAMKDWIYLRWFAHSIEEINPLFNLIFVGIITFSKLKERGIMSVLFSLEKGRFYCRFGGERRLIFALGTIIIIYIEEKNLFYNLRSSINIFRSIIIEPKNKRENNNLVPTSFLLLHRDQIRLFFFFHSYLWNSFSY